MTDQTTISQTYRVCSDPVNDIWRKYSFWGMAEDVILNDGMDLQTKIDSLKDGVDTATTESNTIPINGAKTHERLAKKFADLEAYYKDRINNTEELIDNMSSDGITVPGWDLLVDILNALIADVKDRTDDMLADLEYFDPSDFSTDLLLTQSEHDSLVEEINYIRTQADEDTEALKAILGDVSSMEYMKSDSSGTTDTRIAPLIIKHQAAIDALLAMSTPLTWQELSAASVITPSSNVSGVTGTVRYQKDTGLCTFNVTFNYSGTLAANSNIQLGTINAAYRPVPLCGNDSNMYNTKFVVEVREVTALPEIYGLILDDGTITLYNTPYNGSASYSGNVPMYTTIVANITSS